MRNKQVAVFGGGCFWCVEAVMQRVKGVVAVTSGYGGGETENPDYRSVSSGTTGHVEVVEVVFDGDIITYEELITIFMMTHDPTTINRQGADRGTQYRSVILYRNKSQKVIAEGVWDNMKREYKRQIVTQIVPLDKFYKAEDYHQEYYINNSWSGYCRVVVLPKLQKLQKKFPHMVEIAEA